MFQRSKKAVKPSPEDLDFLYAADAAIHRKGNSLAYLLSVAIMACMIAAVLWAHHAILDEVTRGTGKVIPSRKTQVIQNLEGGIVEEIHVQENQLVSKNDILIRLGNVNAASQYRDSYKQSLQHQATIARLRGEINDTEPIFSNRLLEEVPDVVEDQLAIYNARQNQLSIELKVLNSQYSQKIQEINEMRSRRRQLAANLKLAREQRDIAKPLMERQVYPKVDFLALERDILTIRGNISTLDAAIPRVSSAASEAKNRMEQRKAEFKSMALEELNRHRMELSSLKEILAAGEDRVTRTDVRSPVKGTIKQLAVNTIGGVVRPGEPIVEIVPMDDTLLIEASIRPADIAFLHPGQKAKVKITAYDFSIYGGLDAVVEQISADTLVDDKGDSFYKVKLRTETNAIAHQGSRLPIIPGMTATVDILTGKKSVLDYLLKPILKASQNALRER
jgi:adhesin transport system membrane fusion protein